MVRVFVRAMVGVRHRVVVSILYGVMVRVSIWLW